MSRTARLPHLFAATLVVLTVLPLHHLQAGSSPCGKDENCTSGGSKACVTTGKAGTTERYTWKVVEEEVCVPAIRFPWFSWFSGKSECSDCEGCPGNDRCGNVKVVRRLKKVKFEEDTCKYEHSIEAGEPSCKLEGGIPH